MATGTLRADATASTRATIYQLCLAVDKCYRLKPAQKLLIEELGDITVEDDQQIEVKAYSDALTDGHPNFWNTLTNWLDPKFASSLYESLILFTTQPFAHSGRLLAWNESNGLERLKILTEINGEFEASSTKRAIDPKYQPSKTLKQQRAILDLANRPALLKIIDKVDIEASQPIMSALYEKIRDERSIGILRKNKDTFIEALLGFVCRLGKKSGESWSISYEDFDAECQMLVRMYCSESRQFPTAYFDNFDDDQIDFTREDIFIAKIRDIDHAEFLPEAIREYESTLYTISQEFSDYSVCSKHLHTFRSNVESILRMRYKSAKRSAPGDIASSQEFYTNMVTCEPPVFKGYDDRHMWFRNGVLHMCMNDESKGYQWKLV